MVQYKNGDLLTSDCNVICHQVNCQGVMGAGIAKAIRDKYPQVYQMYKLKHLRGDDKLGDIDIIRVEDGSRPLYVVNLYAQDEYLPRGVCHTNYEAFRECLKKLKAELTYYNSTLPKVKFKIGFPNHIGCGLAGGFWYITRNIIESEFASNTWEVEIWKLN